MRARNQNDFHGRAGTDTSRDLADEVGRTDTGKYTKTFTESMSRARKKNYHHWIWTPGRRWPAKPSKMAVMNSKMAVEDGRGGSGP